MLLETIPNKPMSLMPGWLEKLCMLRHGEHVDKPPGVGGKSQELLFEGQLVEQAIFLQLIPGEQTTYCPESCEDFKP